MQVVAQADAAYGAPDLRLDGGTALAAYYLHHRQSEDLDFFSDPGLNAPAFGDVVSEVAATHGIRLDPYGGRSLGMATYTAHGEGEPENGVRLQFAVQSPSGWSRFSKHPKASASARSGTSARESSTPCATGLRTGTSTICT